MTFCLLETAQADHWNQPDVIRDAHEHSIRPFQWNAKMRFNDLNQHKSITKTDLTIWSAYSDLIWLAYRSLMKMFSIVTAGQSTWLCNWGFIKLMTHEIELHKGTRFILQCIMTADTNLSTEGSYVKKFWTPCRPIDTNADNKMTRTRERPKKQKSVVLVAQNRHFFQSDK